MKKFIMAITIMGILSIPALAETVCIRVNGSRYKGFEIDVIRTLDDMKNKGYQWKFNIQNGDWNIFMFFEKGDNKK